jgi:hypothetical protein
MVFLLSRVRLLLSLALYLYGPQAYNITVKQDAID